MQQANSSVQCEGCRSALGCASALQTNEVAEACGGLAWVSGSMEQTLTWLLGPGWGFGSWSWGEVAASEDQGLAQSPPRLVCV